jgi:glycosyltransferase involved in cell wall biosynthesis
MKIGIVIPTYRKQNGSTEQLLTRTLNSIKNQTYAEYKVFLIGDNYDNKDEFIHLSTSIVENDKIYYKNLPIAIERKKYPIGSSQLWSAGGVNATNFGIEKCIEQDINYVCHLDHDDLWHPQHLELIAHTIKTTGDPAFVYTCGTYFNSYLPNVPLTNEIIPSTPQPGRTIHSSTCINVSKIPLLYRDVYQETGVVEPADADMWARVSKYIIDNQLSSYLITSLTCYHPTEKT